MLIDLAIDEDDEEFVKKLANQYTAYCSDENVRKVVEYLDGKDNGENEKYLFSLLKKIKKHDTLINYMFYCYETFLIKYSKTNQIMQT